MRQKKEGMVLLRQAGETKSQKRLVSLGSMGMELAGGSVLRRWLWCFFMVVVQVLSPWQCRKRAIMSVGSEDVVVDDEGDGPWPVFSVA